MKMRKMLSALLALLLMTAALPALNVAALADDMPFRIGVDITNQIVTIYYNKNNQIVRQMLCSSGADDATPLGTYTMPAKKDDDERTEWYYFRAHNVYAHYATRVYKGIMFHSIPYNHKYESSICKKDVADFGKPASHGCIRLRPADAEFIAKYCKKGTRVKIYKSGQWEPDLRELLYEASYSAEDGMTYKEYLGIPTEKGVMGRFSTGSDVTNLQMRLRDLGIYSDSITGVYRSTTVTAVRKAQGLLGMSKTGIADKEFQAAIYASDAPSAMNVRLTEGMSGPAVRSMQQNLATLKLYDGDIDGVFDVDVVNALMTFQSAYGYSQGATATTEMQKAIYYEAGRVKGLFAVDEGYSVDKVKETIYMGRVDCEVGIRLRESPSTDSEALTSLANGDVVLGLEYGSPWSKVQHGRSVGYVKNEYISYDKRQISRLQYTSDDGERTYTIGYTRKGYLSGAARPAEVFAAYLAASGSLDSYDDLADYATVNTESADITLNLRETPSTSGAILQELGNGTQLQVLIRSGEWSMVEHRGTRGYLLNEYLDFWIGPKDALDHQEEEEETPSEGGSEELYAVVRSHSGDRAAVYDVDSQDASVIGHLEDGVRLRVAESVNGWNLIEHQGHTGYMRDEDLQFVADEFAI